MVTPFASRKAKLSGSIDRAFGEVFTFSAKAVANGDVDLPRVADATRSDFDATAIWDGPAKSQTPHARGSIQDDTAHSWVASLPSVSVADNALSWRPQKGDWIMRQSDGSTYEVSKPLPDGFGRTVFKLTAKKRPPFAPSLDFSDSRDSQYLALIGPGGTFGSLDFSNSSNSGLLAAIGD
jgi:hypothetical protein